MSEFTWWQNSIIVALFSLLLFSWSGFSDFFDPTLNKLFEGRGLKKYEQLVFDTWRASLSLEHRNILDSQLAQLSFFQRLSGSAKIAFFYKKNKCLQLFGNSSPRCHVATVSLGMDEPSPFGPLNAKIFLHEGRFFSIEFAKRPKRMAEQRGWTLEHIQALNLTTHKSIFKTPRFQKNKPR
jgi:hypothetical protein